MITLRYVLHVHHPIFLLVITTSTNPHTFPLAIPSNWASSLWEGVRGGGKWWWWSLETRGPFVTHATNATLLPFGQFLWRNIWKLIQEKSLISVINVAICHLVTVCIYAISSSSLYPSYWLYSTVFMLPRFRFCLPSVVSVYTVK